MANPVMDEIRAKEEAAGLSAEQLLCRSRLAFQDYYRWMDKAHDGSLNDQGTDADKRLKQSVLILTKINSLLEKGREHSRLTEYDLELAQERGHDFATEEWRKRIADHVVRDDDDYEWIELLTEQFYWCSFRARSAMRSLPGLEKFEAVGVRNIRNKLIEHPEGKDSRIFNGGFGWGKEQGPVLAAARTDKQPTSWPDPGLYVNCNEFSQNLIVAIETHLKGLGADS